MRTSWALTSKTPLTLPSGDCIRFFTDRDADKLVQRVRKRNVFARHSWENSFYLNRIRQLANKTIIEVYRHGQPDDFADEARRDADLLEELAILSSSVPSKKRLLRDLGVTLRSKAEVEFIAGSGDRFLRAKTKPMSSAKGLLVDERFGRRFGRYGFAELFAFCVSAQGLSQRVFASINWLAESRLETKLEASIVKTAIALESLLIFSESEHLARSLSERAAFILSPMPEKRRRISKIVRRFYDARSGVVHGSRDKAKRVSAELLETVDRLVIMLNLTIAANGRTWCSQEVLREWCENERWSAPSTNVKILYPDSYLRKALEILGSS
jgi:hypothetical protein